jgi:hypothetical protein
MKSFKKGISILIIFTGCLSISNVSAQEDNVYNLFVKYADLYNSGDFTGAEKCMLTVLESEKRLSPDYIVPVYTNLGLIKKSYCTPKHFLITTRQKVLRSKKKKII